MAKRFIDTGLWQKQWFRKLQSAEKVAWFYILTNCDAVGVWDADLDLAQFCIGTSVDWNGLREAANGNIETLDSGKWWVVDFITYQYGEVKKVSSSKVQQHLSSLLAKHGLTERYFATVGLDVDTGLAPRTKDKDKDKDKDKEELRAGVLLTIGEYQKLVDKYGKKTADACLDKLSAAKLAKGYHYDSDYHAILNWVLGDVVKRGAIPAGKDDGLAWICGGCGKQHRSTAATCECGWERPA